MTSPRSERAPVVGSWWRHPRYRDSWRVEKVGRKYVYLRGQTPDIPDARVDLVMWPFQIKPADAGWMDLGSVAIGCDVDFDRERKQWRAWDEFGNEAWAEWKPLAAARLFVARMEAAMEDEDG